MKRVRKFGPNAFKPKMPMAAPRMKKFAGGGDVGDVSEEGLKARGFKPFDPRDPKEADLLKRLGVPLKEIVRIRNDAIVAGKKEPYRGSGRAFKAPIIGRDEKTGSDYMMLPEDERAPYKKMVKPLGTHKLGDDKNKAKKAFAKGGMVRGGGCESKGKTRGRFV